MIEGRNLGVRRALWDYATLVETQRRIVAGWRDAVFGRSGTSAADVGQADPDDVPFRPAPKLLKEGEARFGREVFARLARSAALFHIDGAWSDHLAWLADLRESIHLVVLARKEPLQEFQKAATEAFLGLEKRITQDVKKTLRALIEREGPVDPEKEGLKGPSSTWTYLVNEDQLGWGLEMLKGTNIGFSAAAAALYGPLFVLALIANRFKKKK